MAMFRFVPLCLSLAAGQLTSTTVKIISHGGDCDDSSTWSPNHYGMWGWELIGQGALGNDHRDGSSNFAAFHTRTSSPDCRNNNWFRLDEQSPGVYKILSHGGDCDHSSRWSPNHYGMSGWELVGQGALNNDRRDGSSNFASFHAPTSSPDCRNNNHFVIVPVDIYQHSIEQATVQLVADNMTADIHDESISSKIWDAAPPQLSERLVSQSSSMLQASTLSMCAAGFIASIAVGAVLWRPRRGAPGSLPLLGAEA